MASSRLNALEAEAKTWISAILEEPLDDQRRANELWRTLFGPEGVDDFREFVPR